MTSNNPLQALRHHPVVEQAAAALSGAGVLEAYLVGGAVRDTLLGSAHVGPDLDLAVPTDPKAAIAAAARVLGGAVVPLDEATTRLVFKTPGGPWRLDIARYRGASIQEDLALRDFTVDAMATAIVGGPPGELLDPMGGSADLVERTIRHVYAAAFADDPLRTLRAVRLAAVLGGTIAQETRPLIRQAAPGLARASGERIRDEVVKIFGAPHAARWARELDDLGLLGVLVPASAAMKTVPASPPHRLGLWEHSLEVVRLLEAILDEPGRWLPEDAAEIAQRAGETVEGEIPRRSLLLLFALLHDVGKPSTRTVESDGRVRFPGHVEAGTTILADLAERLRLGRRAGDVLDRMERGHMRPILLGAEPSVTPRARYRFFREVGPVAVEVLVHSVADVGGTGGMEGPAWEGHLRLVREMLAFQRERLRPARASLLLSGEEVMAITGIGPGPLVGYTLERLAEAAAMGEVRSRADCEMLVRREFSTWSQAFGRGENR